MALNWSMSMSAGFASFTGSRMVPKPSLPLVMGIPFWGGVLYRAS